MISRRVITVALGAAWVMCCVAVSTARQDPAAKNTKPAVFTKAQADAGKARFEKLCAGCHAFDPETRKTLKSTTDPLLGGAPFFMNWDGKMVAEIATLIVLTMPNDGSAVLSEPESLELTAYILHRNGYPAGDKPLTTEGAAAITIVK